MMNKAQRIMKTVHQCLHNEDWTTLTRALKQIKKYITNDKRFIDIFRKLSLTSSLVKILKYCEESTLLCTLSILSTCLVNEQFRTEIHRTGISLLFHVFEHIKTKQIQHRICRVIGQQCIHQQSCARFHELGITKMVISYLNETTLDNDEKESAIKALRCLANTSRHQKSILEENGLLHACNLGLSIDNQKLSSEAISTILQFSKWPTPQFFSQLFQGTDNLLLITKLYEIYDERFKISALQILLVVFFHHSSCANVKEYQQNNKILDYLSMAKLPFMIVAELKKEEVPCEATDKLNLVLALCDFCGLNENWKIFSFNVLPTYHEITWLQLTECGGIELFIVLISTYQSNYHVLENLFRGLLTIEYLHSTKVKVLRYLKSHLLPLLGQIFDGALKEVSCEYNKDSKKYDECHHKDMYPQSRKSRSQSWNKGLSKDMLQFIEASPINSFGSNNDNNSICTSINLAVSNKESTASTSSNTVTTITTTTTNTITTTTVYKEMNKIKFRAGKRKRIVDGKDELVNGASSNTSPIKQPDSIDSPSDCIGTLDISEQSTSANHSSAKNKKFRIYHTVLEYMIRLLYQIAVMKEADITPLCRGYLLKVYQYISESSYVHHSAMKFLSAVAKNSSSIQLVLDNLFIPKLAVDLIQSSRGVNCSQCKSIRDGVREYLMELRRFFNHHHQYGQCEIAYRINPLKSEFVKHSCLVAVTHVVRCPKLLHNFLLEHKGLDSLLPVFDSNSDLKMMSYGFASLSVVIDILKIEYKGKYKGCLFCHAHYNLIDLEAKLLKEQKEQLHKLTSVSLEENIKHSRCLLEQEIDKNCSFKFEHGTICANKETLSVKNEVLKMMLFGSFCESKGNVVEIPDINFHSMQMVIHFIYGCSCQIFYCQDIDVYIELLYLAQMYFIPELKILAVHHISLLIPSNEIFSFMERYREIIDADLLQHIIPSILSQPLSYKDSGQFLDHFVTSTSRSVFVQTLHSGLTRLLKTTLNLCNCDSCRIYM